MFYRRFASVVAVAFFALSSFGLAQSSKPSGSTGGPSSPPAQSSGQVTLEFPCTASTGTFSFKVDDDWLKANASASQKEVTLLLQKLFQEEEKQCKLAPSKAPTSIPETWKKSFGELENRLTSLETRVKELENAKPATCATCAMSKTLESFFDCPIGSYESGQVVEFAGKKIVLAILWGAYGPGWSLKVAGPSYKPTGSYPWLSGMYHQVASATGELDRKPNSSGNFLVSYPLSAGGKIIVEVTAADITAGKPPKIVSVTVTDVSGKNVPVTIASVTDPLTLLK
jgi:hypothetical protein